VDAEFSIELRHAFIARKEDLRKLGKLLTERIGELSLNADCADGLNRKFSSVNELIDYENSKAKELTRLRMTARSEDYKKRAEIDLSSCRWRGISIRIEAREDVVGRLKESVLDVVSEMRPLYSWLHRHDFVFIALGIQIMIGLLPAGLIAVGVAAIPKDASITVQAAAQAILIGLIAPGFAVLLGTIANRFRDQIFPRAVFAVGHAERRLARLEHVQLSVIVGFLVSFAASVVVAIWQAWMA
jgi:hypothetical protein